MNKNEIPLFVQEAMVVISVDQRIRRINGFIQNRLHILLGIWYILCRVLFYELLRFGLKPSTFLAEGRFRVSPTKDNPA